jgi:hypothetical protein
MVAPFVGSRETGRYLMAVARCTRPSRTGPACGDRCPGALLVEELESVQRERRIDVVGDAEWTALGAVDTQPIGSGPVERGEGRDMDVVARRWIVDANAISSVLHGPAISSTMTQSSARVAASAMTARFGRPGGSRAGSG